MERNQSKISDEKYAEVAAQIKEINQYLRTVPYGDPMDSSYKRIVYVRYADDFLIGVIGSKKDAEKVKTDIGKFLSVFQRSFAQLPYFMQKFYF